MALPTIFDAEWWTQEGQDKVKARAERDAAAAERWLRQAGGGVLDAAQAVGEAVAGVYGYETEAAAVNAAVDGVQAATSREDYRAAWGDKWLTVADALAAWVAANGWDRWQVVAAGVGAAGVPTARVQRLVNRTYLLHPALWELPGAPQLTGATATGRAIGGLGEAAADVAADVAGRFTGAGTGSGGLVRS